jgi:hypothetical protein
MQSPSKEWLEGFLKSETKIGIVNCVTWFITLAIGI